MTFISSIDARASVRLGTALGAALLTALALAAPAFGGTASITGGQLVYTGTSGMDTPTITFEVDADETNTVLAEYWYISDLGTVVPGAGCVAVGPSARCEVAAGVTSKRVELGDGDDSLALQTSSTATFLNRSDPALDANVSGGGGDDTLDGGDGADVIDGGPGNEDRITGGLGNDRLEGGDGNDAMFGDWGDDLVSGGAGDDQFMECHATRVCSGTHGSDTYAGGAGSDTLHWGQIGQLTVSLDGVQNDGAAGIPENVQGDVDTIYAGPGADRMIGNDAANVLDGGFGNDVIDGRGGDDRLVGGGADDAIDGGAGKDTIIGEGDVFATGSDSIASRDGEQDVVHCETGVDRVVADSIDLLSLCEQVDVAGGPAQQGQSPTPQTPQASQSLVATLGSAGALTFSARGVSVQADCNPKPCTVTGTATVSLPGAAAVYRSARVTRTFAAGGARRLTLRFSRRGRKAIGRALAPRRAVRVRVGMVARGADGRTTRTTRTYRLKRR